MGCISDQSGIEVEQCPIPKSSIEIYVAAALSCVSQDPDILALL